MYGKTLAVSSIVALLLGSCTAKDLTLSDEELLAYTGEDKSKPIYLAIDGTIYDVSAQPNFYGPGGHYGHFAGRDASRAWVTECWDSPDQLTWRMDDIEIMFTPKWLDEELEKAIAGESLDIELAGIDLTSYLPMMKKVMGKIGTVTPEEKAARRIEDREEAKAQIDAALQKWKSFFADSPKYPAVGKVVREKDSGVAPPPPCEAALKKRPTKNGKLDPLLKMANLGNLGKPAAEGEKKAEMPDFVKQAIAKKDAAKDEL